MKLNNALEKWFCFLFSQETRKCGFGPADLDLGCEFEPSLVYKGEFQDRLRKLQSNPVWKNQNQNQNKNKEKEDYLKLDR